MSTDELMQRATTRRADALLISSSYFGNHGFLEYCKDEISDFLYDVHSVTFVPYALHNHEAYTDTVRERLSPLGFEVVGLHESDDALDTISRSPAMFVGGGNTFVLLKTLQDLGLLDAIRSAFDQGMRYIGTSAGANLAGISVGTTNDMPVVWPSNHRALGLVSFNINPHYIPSDAPASFAGEQRLARLEEFHQYNPGIPVLGLEEGALVRVSADTAVVQGLAQAVTIRNGEELRRFSPGETLPTEW